MNSPFVIGVEDKVCELELELQNFQNQLKRIRANDDWQERNVEDCLGTLDVNLHSLVRRAALVQAQIEAVRKHWK